MRQFVLLIVMIWPLAAMGQALSEGPKPTPDPLESIKEEAKEARKSYVEKTNKAVSTKAWAEVRAADELYQSEMKSLMDRALTLGRLHSGKPEGVGPPAWVAMMAPLTRRDKEVAKRVDAAFRLLAEAPTLDDPELGGAMLGGVGPECPEAEPFLRSVISRSRNPRLVMSAQFHLGEYLAELVRMHDRLNAPFSGPELTKSLAMDRIDHLRAIDGEKLRGEADALLGRVFCIDTNPDEKRGETAKQELDLANPVVGDMRYEAACELYRLRALKIGEPAPELVGEDLDGAPLRLSDFRGKVVVLAFWKSLTKNDLFDRWNDLVGAMKGRPFVLVGVNGNSAEDRAKVKEAVKKNGVTWRSFWAGGPNGRVLRTWSGGKWPTVYVIDAKGIIRDDQAGEKLTPAALESLVQEAEKAAR